MPELIKLNKGYLTRIEGKPALLYKYIPGKQLKRFSKKQLMEVGEFNANFHNQGKKFSWNKYRDKHYRLPKSKLDRIIAAAEEAKLGHLTLLHDLIIELEENKLNENLPEGPVHVDIKPENVLFYKGKLSGVLDFDNSYIGYFLLDLAKTMVWFGLEGKFFNIEKSKIIYDGYIEKRNLSSLEYSELYKAIKFAFLSHIIVDYYKRALGIISSDYFEFMVNDFYRAYKSFKLTQEEFYKFFKN